MFTGLIEELGTVRRFSPEAGRLEISCGLVLEGTRTGDSIAVNGVCLTVTERLDGACVFHVSRTTSRATLFSPGQCRPGTVVNLERALAFGSRMGGHMVTGHVDGTARLSAIEREGGHVRMEFIHPESIAALIAAKGSVAVDGVSLTVAAVRSRSFVVAVIPETFERTTLGVRRPGDLVHIEADIMARYVVHAFQTGGISHAPWIS